MAPAGPVADAALDDAALDDDALDDAALDDDALDALVGTAVAGTAVAAGAELDDAELDAGGGIGVAVGAGAHAATIKTRTLNSAMDKNNFDFISSPLKLWSKFPTCWQIGNLPYGLLFSFDRYCSNGEYATLNFFSGLAQLICDFVFSNHLLQ